MAINILISIASSIATSKAINIAMNILISIASSIATSKAINIAMSCLLILIKSVKYHSHFLDKVIFDTNNIKLISDVKKYMLVTIIVLNRDKCRTLGVKVATAGLS